MRQRLSQLLVLLLCLPYLACAMPACGHDVTQVQSDGTACVNHEKAPVDNVEPLMFLSDCAEVDVTLVQTELSSKQIDVKQDLVALGADSNPFIPHVDIKQHTEPWYAQTVLSHTSIILSTQRLRL